MNRLSLLSAGVLFITTSALAAPIDAIKVPEDLRRPEDPALVSGAKSKDASVRERVAQAWGRIQRPISIDRLYVLLADADASVREAARVFVVLPLQPHTGEAENVAAGDNGWLSGVFRCVDWVHGS